MPTPEDRLEALRRAGAVRLTGTPERVESYSNDTWLARTVDGDDVVLRVCWIGDRARLLREATIGTALPAEVGYPTVLESGTLAYEDDTITWMLAERLSGSSLMDVWPTLTVDQQERALPEVAELIQRLHAWHPPSEVLTWLRPTAPTDDPDTVVGTSMLPLPLDRVLHLVGPAAARASSHRDTILAAGRWLVDHADLLPVLDDPADGVVLHGDLHLGNVWWNGTRVSGLLDLEWVRLGPSWVDLSRVRDNALAGDEFAAAHADLFAVLRRLLVPDVLDLDARLRATIIAYELREVMIWTPPGPHPVDDHPVELLRRLLDGE